MNITPALIKAICTIYSTDEIKSKIAEFTTALLENPDVIISASSGTGQSYSKQIVATPDKLIELFSYALEYAETGTISGGGSGAYSVVASPIF